MIIENYINMVQKTTSTRAIKEKEIVRSWHLVDLSRQTLGRVSTEIAKHLIGKSKVSYVPYLDQGDYVVVINVKQVKVSGKKETEKKYSYYSGYPGGIRTVVYERMMKNTPKEIIRHAVTGMLPKNKFRDPRLARLFIYEGKEHPYEDKFKK